MTSLDIQLRNHYPNPNPYHSPCAMIPGALLAHLPHESLSFWFLPNYHSMKLLTMGGILFCSETGCLLSAVNQLSPGWLPFDRPRGATVIFLKGIPLCVSWMFASEPNFFIAYGADWDGLSWLLKLAIQVSVKSLPNSHFTLTSCSQYASIGGMWPFVCRLREI